MKRGAICWWGLSSSSRILSRPGISRKNAGQGRECRNTAMPCLGVPHLKHAGRLTKFRSLPCHSGVTEVWNCWKHQEALEGRVAGVVGTLPVSAAVLGKSFESLLCGRPGHCSEAVKPPHKSHHLRCFCRSHLPGCEVGRNLLPATHFRPLLKPLLKVPKAIENRQAVTEQLGPATVRPGRTRKHGHAQGMRGCPATHYLPTCTTCAFCASRLRSG